MTTTLEKFTPETAIAFPVDTTEIAEAVAPCLAMKIAGVNDVVGFKAVHEARMKLKDMRVSIEKTRVELKAKALEYGRLVDSEAKRLTAPLLPAEEHLEAEEKRIKAEKDRIKAEAEAARQRKIQERVTALSECRASVDLAKVSAMSDEEFDAHLRIAVEANQRRLEAEAEAEAERKREQARLDAEAAERRKTEEARLAEQREQQRVEDERLAAERAELERQRREQQERQASLEAEQRRLDASRNPLPLAPTRRQPEAVAAKPKATMRRVHIDTKVVVHPGWMGIFHSEESRAASLEKWAEELCEVLKDHPSQNEASVTVERVYEEQCSVCGEEWDVAFNGDEPGHCGMCGAEIEVTR